MPKSNARLRELVQRCITDDAFANEFLRNPQGAAAEYNLEAAQVQKIAELAEQGLISHDVQPHAGTPAYY